MAVQEILQVMKDKGCKITPQRRLLIEILHAGRHKTAVMPLNWTCVPCSSM